MFGGTSRLTTLPALTSEFEPISTPGKTMAPAAIQHPDRIVIGRVTSGKLLSRKLCEPVQRYARCEMQTFDSIVTWARLRIPTSSPIQTWSPARSRQGNEIFTLERITTFRPIVAPNQRRRLVRSEEGHGIGVWKKRERRTIHAASFSQGAPRSKSRLL